MFKIIASLLVGIFGGILTAAKLATTRNEQLEELHQLELQVIKYEEWNDGFKTADSSHKTLHARNHSDCNTCYPA